MIKANAESHNLATAAAEKLIQDLDHKIETLKSKYILFFNGDENLPPEKARVELEKSIRSLLSNETKSARLNMLIQNLATKFSLYNNLWLKKLNEREFGVPQHGARSTATPLRAQKAEPVRDTPKAEKAACEADINLNDESTFDHFFHLYREMLPTISDQDSEKVVNAMKIKLISNNLVRAHLRLSLQNGKLNIKIKSSD